MILVANIGNRNVTYKGQTYFERIGDTPKEESFLLWSKKLLDNFNSLSEEIDINIINPLVDGSGDTPDAIYLFYSDQSAFDTRTNQDTIFEAQLMKKVLIEKYGYHDDSVVLEPVKSKVIDNGKLLEFYQGAWRKIRFKYPNDLLLICDAGGTAQQKMALKVMAEYVLNKTSYQIKYVEDNEIVTDVNTDEYRKVINNEQAKALIRSGQYEAARMLLEYPIIERGRKITKGQNLFAIAYFRFYGMHKEARNHSQRKDWTIDHHRILRFYRDGIPLCTNNHMSDSFGEENVIRLVDFLSRSLFYHSIGDYNNSVLDLSRCYEFFLYLAIEIEYGYKLSSGYYKEESDKFIDYIMCHSPQFPYVNHPSAGVPTWLNVGLSSDIDFVRSFCSALAPYISHTSKSLECVYINSVRNQVAHNGLFISYDYYISELAYYPDLLDDLVTILGVDHPNLFEELAEIVTSKI